MIGDRWFGDRWFGDRCIGVSVNRWNEVFGLQEKFWGARLARLAHYTQTRNTPSRSGRVKWRSAVTPLVLPALVCRVPSQAMRGWVQTGWRPMINTLLKESAETTRRCCVLPTTSIGVRV